MTKNVAVLIGSLRKDSFSKAIAKQLMPLFPEDMHLEVIEIGDLPLYNQDYDDLDQVPEAYTTFRNKMQQMDAVLFVTPEYNRLRTGRLKKCFRRWFTALWCECLG